MEKLFKEILKTPNESIQEKEEESFILSETADLNSKPFEIEDSS